MDIHKKEKHFSNHYLIPTLMVVLILFTLAVLWLFQETNDNENDLNVLLETMNQPSVDGNFSHVNNED